MSGHQTIELKPLGQKQLKNIFLDGGSQALGKLGFSLRVKWTWYLLEVETVGALAVSSVPSFGS